MKQVVLIGDSIRMYYQDVVKAELADVAEVWSSNENGGTSTNVLSRLEEWTLSRKPDLVHINCGLHDIKKPLDTDNFETPIAVYEANVRSILTQLKDSGTKVIWVTTTPVNGEWHHATKGFDRWEADVDTYNEVASRVARELDIPINDLFAVVTEAGKNELLTPDGVHFKPEGNEVLGKAVAAKIREML